MDYSSHPWIKGFRDEDDSTLLEAAISQMDYSIWVENGAKFGKGSMPDEVKAAIREKFSTLSRAALEALLYHSIMAAVTAKPKKQKGKKPVSAFDYPETYITTGIPLGYYIIDGELEPHDADNADGRYCLYYNDMPIAIMHDLDELKQYAQTHDVT